MRSIMLKVDTGTAELQPDEDVPDAWMLRLHGIAQSHVNVNDPTMIAFDYVYRFVDLIEVLAPAGPIDIVHLGGGLLTLPRCLNVLRPGSNQHVIEIDGRLMQAVLSRLPLAEDDKTEITIADARDGVAKLPEGSADIIIGDVFNSVRPPEQVTTVEFVRTVATALRPNGHYLLNIMDKSPFRYARRHAATLKEVFPEVAVVFDTTTWRGRNLGNILMVAGHTPLKGLPARLAGDPKRLRIELGRRLPSFIGVAEPFTD